MQTGTYTLGFIESNFWDGFAPQVFVVATSPTTSTHVVASATTTSTVDLTTSYYGTTTLMGTSLLTMLTTLPAQPASTLVKYANSTATTDTVYVTPAAPVNVTSYTGTSTETLYQTNTVTVTFSFIRQLSFISQLSFIRRLSFIRQLSFIIKTQPHHIDSVQSLCQIVGYNFTNEKYQGDDQLDDDETHKVNKEIIYDISACNTNARIILLPQQSAKVLYSQLQSPLSSRVSGYKKALPIYAASHYTHRNWLCKMHDYVQSISISKHPKRLQGDLDVSRWPRTAKETWDARLLPRSTSEYEQNVTASSSSINNNGGPDLTYAYFPATTVKSGTTTVDVTVTPSAGFLTIHHDTLKYSNVTVTPDPSGVVDTTVVSDVTGYATVNVDLPETTVTVGTGTTTTTVVTAAASDAVQTETVLLEATHSIISYVQVTVTETTRFAATGCLASTAAVALSA
ncbi:hypothetical protein MBLNU459_g0450t1 [Dothideomycetes sp. NU459]